MEGKQASLFTHFAMNPKTPLASRIKIGSALWRCFEHKQEKASNEPVPRKLLIREREQACVALAVLSHGGPTSTAERWQWGTAGYSGCFACTARSTPLIQNITCPRRRTKKWQNLTVLFLVFTLLPIVIYCYRKTWELLHLCNSKDHTTFWLVVLLRNSQCQNYCRINDWWWAGISYWNIWG